MSIFVSVDPHSGQVGMFSLNESIVNPFIHKASATLPGTTTPQAPSYAAAQPHATCLHDSEERRRGKPNPSVCCLHVRRVSHCEAGILPARPQAGSLRHIHFLPRRVCSGIDGVSGRRVTFTSGPGVSEDGLLGHSHKRRSANRRCLLMANCSS